MAKIEPAIYPDIPTSIRQINLEYIATYLEQETMAGNISADTLAALHKQYEELVADKGPALYFIPYRKEFAKRFFPSVVKKGKTNIDLGDVFRKLRKL